MKLMSFRRPDGTASWGIAVADGVIDCAGIAPRLRDGLTKMDVVATAAKSPATFAYDAIAYLPVVPDPDKILCIGLNYATHIAEGGREPPKKPMIFVRFPNSQVGHLQPLVRPKASHNFDFEGELVVVIGQTCRHVPREKAFDVIAGYSCYNDGSIRDWQRHTGQFTPGKNFYQSGGFGPYLITKDEVGDITEKELITRLNGEVMQHAPINDLLFDIPALIEYCSTFTQLEPGDVIVTGTTGGVGYARTPPVWMKPGDTIEIEVTGVGVLRNTVIDEV
jgi:2-keto-4-pentenoate hydratase/2-oxohepta-3-ene-1,7-dioic acid hydratase in catechol pathway